MKKGWEGVAATEAASGRVGAVVLTALGVEYAAMRAQVSDVVGPVHRNGTLYEIGQLRGAGRGTQVAIAEVGRGARVAAAHVERAVAAFEPRVLLFVGIAGSLKPKSVKLGDVVVAEKVYAYQRGKATHEFLPRPDVFNPTHDLEQVAKHVRQLGRWCHRLDPNRHTTPTVHFEPIATGDVVLDGEGGGLRRLLEASYSDAAAIEMEGAGFLAAASLGDVSALVVRGISDLASNKGGTDGEGWQERAAGNAAAFAAEVLGVAASPTTFPNAQAGTEASTTGPARISIGEVSLGSGDGARVTNSVRIGGNVGNGNYVEKTR